MKLVVPVLVLFACVVTDATAKPKQFRILGGQKITAEVQRGMPLPAEKDGVTIEVAAFMVLDGKFIFTFGLDSDHPLKRVLVEDVTGESAVVMLDDVSPKRDWTYWKGDASPLPISRDALPWIWQKGATTKVFRFTLWTPDRAEPIVVFQPAVYAGGTKELVRKQAESRGRANQRVDGPGEPRPHYGSPLAIARLSAAPTTCGVRSCPGDQNPWSVSFLGPHSTEIAHQ